MSPLQSAFQIQSLFSLLNAFSKSMNFRWSGGLNSAPCSKMNHNVINVAPSGLETRRFSVGQPFEKFFDAFRDNFSCYFDKGRKHKDTPSNVTFKTNAFL